MNLSFTLTPPSACSHQQLDEIRRGLEAWLDVVIGMYDALPTPSIILVVRFCSPRQRMRRSRKHFRRVQVSKPSNTTPMVAATPADDAGRT